MTYSMKFNRISESQEAFIPGYASPTPHNRHVMSHPTSSELPESRGQMATRRSDRAKHGRNRDRTTGINYQRAIPAAIVVALICCKLIDCHEEFRRRLPTSDGGDIDHIHSEVLRFGKAIADTGVDEAMNVLAADALNTELHALRQFGQYYTKMRKGIVSQKSVKTLLEFIKLLKDQGKSLKLDAANQPKGSISYQVATYLRGWWPMPKHQFKIRNLLDGAEYNILIKFNRIVKGGGFLRYFRITAPKCQDRAQFQALLNVITDFNANHHDDIQMPFHAAAKEIHAGLLRMGVELK